MYTCKSEGGSLGNDEKRERNGEKKKNKRNGKKRENRKKKTALWHDSGVAQTKLKVGPGYVVPRPLHLPLGLFFSLPSFFPSLLPLRSTPLKSSCKLPSGVWGRAPAEIEFGAS